MRYLLSFLTALVLSTSLGFAQNYYPITGHLKDERAKPIVGAKVTLFTADEVIAEDYTDEKGNYTFKDVKPGDYDFMILTSSGRRLIFHQQWIDNENTFHEMNFTIPMKNHRKEVQQAAKEREKSRKKKEKDKDKDK